MPLVNPYKAKIKTLDDVKDMSYRGADAIDIFREHMVSDSSHDESHIVRVVRNALWFGRGGNIDVIIPAAVLHDIVNIPKDSDLRPAASRMSAWKATRELNRRMPFTLNKDLSNKDWSEKELEGSAIFHAIEAHSWSAGVTPVTLEAKALQDADRVDSLGMIGIARLFATGGSLGSILFHPTDPLGEHRELDEAQYTLDHYFIKLQKLHTTMQTDLGKQYASELTTQMESFIWNLKEEV